MYDEIKMTIRIRDSNIESHDLTSTILSPLNRVFTVSPAISATGILRGARPPVSAYIIKVTVR